MASRITIKRSGLPWLDKLRRDIAREMDMRRPFSPRNQLIKEWILHREDLPEGVDEAIEAVITYIDALHERILPSASYTATFVPPNQSWPSVYVRMAPKTTASGAGVG